MDEYMVRTAGRCESYSLRETIDNPVRLTDMVSAKQLIKSHHVVTNVLHEASIEVHR